VTDVPCNGCRACCQGRELVVLHPSDGDQPELYHEKFFLPGDPGRWVLKHKANGDCAYLGAKGCTIYAGRPAMCRAFDCRKFFLRVMGDMNRHERRAAYADGSVDKRIMKAGLERVPSLSREEIQQEALERLRRRDNAADAQKRR